MKYTHRIWCSLSSRFPERSKHSQVVCFGGETTRAVNSFMISRVLNRDHSRMAKISKNTVKYSVSKCLPLISLIYLICLSTFNSSYFHPNLPLDWMQRRNKRHTPNKKNIESSESSLAVGQSERGWGRGRTHGECCADSCSLTGQKSRTPISWKSSLNLLKIIVIINTTGSLIWDYYKFEKNTTPNISKFWKHTLANESNETRGYTIMHIHSSSLYFLVIRYGNGRWVRPPRTS